MVCRKTRSTKYISITDSLSHPRKPLRLYGLALHMAMQNVRGNTIMYISCKHPRQYVHNALRCSVAKLARICVRWRGACGRVYCAVHMHGTACSTWPHATWCSSCYISIITLKYNSINTCIMLYHTAVASHESIISRTKFRSTALWRILICNN